MEISMRSETTEPPVPGIDATDLAPAAVFDLLADDRRRYALHYLSTAVGAVELADLAEQVTLREGDATEDRYERVRTDLYHHHVPRLADAGVARYDPDRETVALRDAADRLAPFLKLVAADDVR